MARALGSLDFLRQPIHDFDHALRALRTPSPRHTETRTVTSDVRRAILELLREKGPIGWYGIELRLRVPRSTFQDGYTLMTYIEELIAVGSVERVTVDDQERFVAADQR